MGLTFNVTRADTQFNSRLNKSSNPVPYELEETRVLGSTILNRDSRYSQTSLLEFVTPDISFKVMGPWRLPRIPKDANRYMQITNSTAYRPDRISYLAYGSTTYWWYVMLANNLLDFEELTVGRTLVIPPES